MDKLPLEYLMASSVREVVGTILQPEKRDSLQLLR